VLGKKFETSSMEEIDSLKRWRKKRGLRSHKTTIEREMGSHKVSGEIQQSSVQKKTIKPYTKEFFYPRGRNHTTREKGSLNPGKEDADTQGRETKGHPYEKEEVLHGMQCMKKQKWCSRKKNK